MDIHELANEADRDWLRDMIDYRWLRLYLLVELGVPLNMSKVARALGVGRSQANHWLEQIKGLARKAQKPSLTPLQVNAREALDRFVNTRSVS
jgi:hypothetical protein